MIARKNLERLASARAKAEPGHARSRWTPACSSRRWARPASRISDPAGIKTLSTLSAGDEVALKSVGSRLTVETMAGEYISDVEPKLALRLAQLIDGGNKYAAAVAGVTADRVKRHHQGDVPASVTGRAGSRSLLARPGEVVRAYTKESLVRSDMDDDDDWPTRPRSGRTRPRTRSGPTEPREVNLFDAAREEDGRRARIRRVAVPRPDRAANQQAVRWPPLSSLPRHGAWGLRGSCRRRRLP